MDSKLQAYHRLWDYHPNSLLAVVRRIIQLGAYLSVSVWAVFLSQGLCEKGDFFSQTLTRARLSVYRLESQKHWHCANEVARWMKALAVKPDDLSSVPETRMVEEENRLLNVSLSPSHVSYSICACVHICALNKEKWYKLRKESLNRELRNSGVLSVILGTTLNQW